MSLSVTVTYVPDGSPLLATKRSINLLVSRLQSGKDVSREVYGLAKDELKHGMEDYMLYWPERKVWIFPEKPIGLFRLESGAKLEYRPRKRCLKLRFLDASSKLVFANETQPVKRLVEDICEQLRIDHPEELSLVVAGDYAVQKHHPAKNKSMSMTKIGSASPHESHKAVKREKSLSGIPSKPSSDSRSLSPSIRRKQRPGSASNKKPIWTASKVKKQISKKHQIRLDTPWLDPTKTLAEQEVMENDELILMYRFYYHMEIQRGSANVEMLYKQARATYLAGELLCSPNDMVRLSAILCQITKGDYSLYKYNADFIGNIKSLIAPPKCKIKAISKQIVAQHSSLEGLSVTDAKCWFVKLWSSLELFGMEFLSCTNIDTKEKSLIGISKDKVMFLYHKKKNTFWDIDKLMHWTHDATRDSVSLTFIKDKKETEVLNLSLPDYSGVLVDCLQGHREVGDTVPDIVRACSEYQFDDEMESALSAFATQTKRDAKVRRALNSLTYEDVYWASKIENPLLSTEELAKIKTESWENPVFTNMDQLMDERFNFLDFESSGQSPEDSSHPPPGTTTTTTTSTTAGHLSPSHARMKLVSSSAINTSTSPLIVSRRRVQSSSKVSPCPRDDLEATDHSGGSEVGGVHQVYHSSKAEGGIRRISSESESSSSGHGAGGGGSNSEPEGEPNAAVPAEADILQLSDSNSGLPQLTVR